MKLGAEMRVAIHRAIDEIVVQAKHLKDTGYSPGFIDAAISHAVAQMEDQLRSTFAPKLAEEILAEVRQAITAQRRSSTTMQ